MSKVVMAAALALLAACSSSPAPANSAAPTRPSGTPATTGSPKVSPGPPIRVDSLAGGVVFSDDTNDVWSMWADGTHVRRLTSDPAQEFDPSWSPDGSTVVYRHQTGDDQTTEIFVMNADGSGQRALTRNLVADWGPDWSPDGSEIAFNSAMGTGGVGLFGYIVSPGGSGLRRLGSHYVEYPAWSPDGSRIAFMAQEPGASGSDPTTTYS